MSAPTVIPQIPEEPFFRVTPPSVHQMIVQLERLA
jgi:hypothetical protein